MKKESFVNQMQLQAHWPEIYQMIRNPPPGTIKPYGGLPPFDKIVLDTSPETSFGHVTTEDVNEDGSLDIIHINSPRLAQEFQKVNSTVQNYGGGVRGMPPELLKPLLEAFVEIISHELGHVADYDHEGDVSFPGGEAVADTAARSALQQISVATTNNKNKLDKLGSFNMEKNILEELKSLADRLDSGGHTKLADKAEGLMATFAQMGPQRFSGDPAGMIVKDKLLTGQVQFDWGNYTGEAASTDYFVLSGHRELGSVQFPGDPFTYEPADEGMLLVISGPEMGKHMVGKTTEDPRGSGMVAKTDTGGDVELDHPGYGKMYIENPPLPSEIEPGSTRNVYEVKEGDTLENIAESLGLMADDLIRWNNLEGEPVPGESLYYWVAPLEIEAKNNEEDIEKTASEITNSPTKEELQAIFWTGRSTGPFGRD